MDITTNPLQTCVVGCGQCGSRIAAIFDKTPSFLWRRTFSRYPVRCFALDTDPGLPTSLTNHPWNWHNISDIRIIPVVPSETVLQRALSKRVGVPWENLYRAGSGAGGFPYMGTIIAQEFLLQKTELSDDLINTLQTRGFTEGALLVSNSLSGGTGTGFSPNIPEFFAKFFPRPRITLNLAIIPEIRHFEEKQTYPANIVYGLFQISRSNRFDAIILADNDILNLHYKCDGNEQYNSKLHEILSSILLAPLHEYDCANFGKTMDFADIQRALRPRRGFGLPELCALSFSTKKLPSWLGYLFLRLRSRASRKSYMTTWLQSLVNSIITKTEDNRPAFITTIGLVRKPVLSAVGVLSGPPQFFSRILDGNNKHYYDLEQYGKEMINPGFKLAFLQFPEIKEVRLSLIISGVTSERLEEIYRGVIPPEEWKNEGSLMDRIRSLNPKTVEDLMLKEVREGLSRELPPEDEKSL